MKMRNSLFKKILLIIAPFFVIATFIISSPAQAVSGSDLFKKAALQGLAQCYDNHMQETIYTVNPDKGPIYQTQGTLLKDTSGTILFPTGSTNGPSGAKDDTVTCGELFTGLHGLTINGFFAPQNSSPGAIGSSGIFGLFGKTAAQETSSLDEQISFLNNMGYSTAPSDSISNECFSFKYSVFSSKPAYEANNGIYSSNKICKTADSGWAETVQANPPTGFSLLLLPHIDGTETIGVTTGSNIELETLDPKRFNDEAYVKGMFESRIFPKLTYTDYDSVKFDSYQYEARNESSYYVATLNSNHITAFANAGRFLTGNNSLSLKGTSFSNAEIIDLYNHYIQDFYGMPITCGITGENLYKYGTNSDEIEKQRVHDDCYVYSRADALKNGGKKLGKNVRPVVSGSLLGINTINVLSDTSIGYDELVAALKALYSDATPEDLKELEEIEENTTPDEVEPNNCYDNSASLGWIICPIMDKLSDALDKLYDDIIEPFLDIEPSLLDEDHGAFQAWQIMVNFANILMVIFLLFIIFSQLTGVGIDNYGIKKSLPKILVAALLINLSYLICQLAVDVSNIIGNSINDLLTNIGYGIKPTVPAEVYTEAGVASQDQAAWFKGLVTLGVGGLVGIGVANVALNVIDRTILPGIVIPALILIVTAIFSIIFFFVILGARKAGVVVMVVIAPLAFACYMLPNMKKYYDKWFKIFSGLLIVYPICGLLVGGGYLVSRVLLQSSSEYIMYFTASALTVVPYFFIPSMLKGSLNVMGGLGTKISGFGKNIGSRAGRTLGKTIESSKGYQEHMKQNQEQAAYDRALKIKNKLDKQANGDPKNLSHRQRMQLMAADSAVLAQKDKENRADNMIKSGYAAMSTAQEKRAESEDVANHMMLINSRTNGGANEDELLKMFNEYMEAGNTAGAVAATRIAGRRGDTASKFMEKTIMDRTKNYDSYNLSKVAKEMSEGENSKNFRASSPLGFEYVSDINKGTAKNAAEAPATDYADWLSNKENVSNAMNHHITNDSQLVGTQKSNLQEMAQLIEAGHISDVERDRIRALAQDTIKNRDKGAWDTTKADEIYRLAYGEGYQQQMEADGVPSRFKNTTTSSSSDSSSTSTSISTPTSSSTPTSTSTPASTSAQPGETFIVHGASGDQAVTIRDGRAFDQNGNEFDNSRAVARQVRQIVDQRNNNGNNNDNNNGENNVNNNQPQ